MTPQFTFGTQSRRRLAGVHPHLRYLAEVALHCSSIDFSITEGSRSMERQRELVESGASLTMMSRHLKSWVPRHQSGYEELQVKAGYYCHAIDVAPYIEGRIRWDWPLFHKIASAFEKAYETIMETHKTTIEFEWGGDWRTFKDGPHFQLPFSTYPYLEKPMRKR